MSTPPPVAASSAPPEASDLERAERAFARAAGSTPIPGNAVRLLLDAGENFPAWLDAIARAERSILFESYIVDDDAVGREFASALAARARAGVRVCVICDWVGAWGSGALWKMLREAGAEVRVFNPPRLDSPLGWLTRDHRKTIVIDGGVGFVSGLCVSAKWLGNARRRLEPWRDTGIEIRGPAVAELTHAFTQVWAACGGTPPAAQDLSGGAPAPVAGDVRLRVIAGAPSATGMYRLDLVIAALARRQLWLTDAYFIGTAAYVQALGAAARDGVDVRLLVPGASDLPAVSALSRAGYRPLLEAGVRVFEWRGTMLHAKTAVADGYWARVGSTNLNIASWLSNYELDVAIEDAGFAQQMGAQYERDLGHATEILLTRKNRVRRAEPEAESPRTARRAMSGSAGRAAAGAVSVGSALGAALTNRRTLGPAEAGLIGEVGVAAIVVGIVGALWPRVVAWPLAFVATWLGIAWLARAVELRRRKPPPGPRAPGGDGGPNSL